MEKKHFDAKIPDSHAEGLALDKLGEMGWVRVDKNGVEIKIGFGEELIEGTYPTAVAALEWVLAKRRRQQHKG